MALLVEMALLRWKLSFDGGDRFLCFLCPFVSCGLFLLLLCAFFPLFYFYCSFNNNVFLTLFLFIFCRSPLMLYVRQDILSHDFFRNMVKTIENVRDPTVYFAKLRRRL
jgi:hypothetical protein